MLPVIDLAPRGEDGMVASVEETESSASSTSSGRHSAALPIVGPPRGLLARVSREEKSFSGFFCDTYIYISAKAVAGGPPFSRIVYILAVASGPLFSRIVYILFTVYIEVQTNILA